MRERERERKKKGGDWAYDAFWCVNDLVKKITESIDIIMFYIFNIYNTLFIINAQ